MTVMITPVLAPKVSQLVSQLRQVIKWRLRSVTVNFAGVVGAYGSPKHT
jgi:ribosomal protein L16 Arg81 hydroxylase